MWYYVVMVAKSDTTRWEPVPAWLAGERVCVVQFSHQETIALMSAGFIPEDGTIELLDGFLVRKDRSALGEDLKMVGTAHRNCVENLSLLRSRLADGLVHLQSQQPLLCAEDHTPEPDAMLVRGTLKDYVDRDVTASDVLCVIEVADSSYERDVGLKLTRYAQAGVGQYVVINLRNGTAEVYTQPKADGEFGERKVIESTGRLSLCTGDEQWVEVAMSAILP